MECLRRQEKQTAAERYADHHRNIAALVGLLCEELDAHREKASREPNEWGFPSDLGYVRRSLKDVLLFLIAPRLKSKNEAARFIESYIEAFNREKPKT